MHQELCWGLLHTLSHLKLSTFYRVLECPFYRWWRLRLEMQRNLLGPQSLVGSQVSMTSKYEFFSLYYPLKTIYLSISFFKLF